MFEFDGYAYKSDEESLRKAIAIRYEEIFHLKRQFKWVKTPGYAHCRFEAIAETDAARELSARDVLILADEGNLCFGGFCEQADDRFTGKYYTD
jgi:hypothetical protein